MHYPLPPHIFIFYRVIIMCIVYMCYLFVCTITNEWRVHWCNTISEGQAKLAYKNENGLAITLSTFYDHFASVVDVTFLAKKQKCSGPTPNLNKQWK